MVSVDPQNAVCTPPWDLHRGRFCCASSLAEGGARRAQQEKLKICTVNDFDRGVSRKPAHTNPRTRKLCEEIVGEKHEVARHLQESQEPVGHDVAISLFLRVCLCAR